MANFVPGPKEFCSPDIGETRNIVSELRFTLHLLPQFQHLQSHESNAYLPAKPPGLTQEKKNSPLPDMLNVELHCNRFILSGGADLHKNRIKISEGCRSGFYCLVKRNKTPDALLPGTWFCGKSSLKKAVE